MRVDTSAKRNPQQVLPFFLLSEAVAQHKLCVTHLVEGTGKRAADKSACSGDENHGSSPLADGFLQSMTERRFKLLNEGGYICEKKSPAGFAIFPAVRSGRTA